MTGQALFEKFCLGMASIAKPFITEVNTNTIYETVPQSINRMVQVKSGFCFSNVIILLYINPDLGLTMSVSYNDENNDNQYQIIYTTLFSLFGHQI